MVALDELFAYETAKVARIRDRRLGIIYVTFIGLILGYVVGFEILYCNEHFKRRDVFGTARLTIQQPTKNACNPNKRGCKSDFPPLTTLPYCSVYKGNSTEVDVENRHDCIFADQHTLAPTGMLTGEMLVPTRIDKMKETKNCEPAPENGYTCDNEYELDHDEKIIYVADIERYTIMLSHTYKRGYIKGNNQYIQGYLLECDDEKRDERTDDTTVSMEHFTTTLYGKKECNKYVRKTIECITDDCPFLQDKEQLPSAFLQRHPGSTSAFANEAGNRRKKRAIEAHQLGIHFTAQEKEQIDRYVASDGQEDQRRVNPAKLAAGGYYAIPSGDIFSIGKLLELCGLSLDTTINMEGEPLRVSGTVIEIEVIYSNLTPFLSSFGFTPVRYEYKVSKRPMEEMKTELLSQYQPGYPERRTIEDRHGLYVTVKITGQFGFFSVTYLLIMLTTALALLSVAIVITDKLALYVLPERETFHKHKYEVFTVSHDDKEGSELPSQD